MGARPSQLRTFVAGHNAAHILVITHGGKDLKIVVVQAPAVKPKYQSGLYSSLRVSSCSMLAATGMILMI